MLWNQLFQTHTFFEEIHGMCKHCQIVIFHIFLGMCIVYLNNANFSLSIFGLTHLHVAHSFVLLITLFNYVPHVLISRKCQKGSSLISLCSNDFFVISQILSNIFEINVYLIIDSKVFGVNFLLPIIKQRFHDYRHLVKVERMQLDNKGGINANSNIDWENQ